MRSPYPQFVAPTSEGGPERIPVDERVRGQRLVQRLENRFPGEVGKLVGQIALNEVYAYLEFGYRISKDSLAARLLRALEAEADAG